MAELDEGGHLTTQGGGTLGLSPEGKCLVDRFVTMAAATQFPEKILPATLYTSLKLPAE